MSIWDWKAYYQRQFVTAHRLHQACNPVDHKNVQAAYEAVLYFERQFSYYTEQVLAAEFNETANMV